MNFSCFGMFFADIRRLQEKMMMKLICVSEGFEDAGKAAHFLKKIAIAAVLAIEVNKYVIYILYTVDYFSAFKRDC